MADDQKPHGSFSNILLGSLEGLSRIRLGPGVVGNTHTTALVALLAIAIVSAALREQPAYAVVIDGGIIAFAIYLARGTWKFARESPDLALLGGSELLRLRLTQMAGKGIGEIPVLTPGTPPPAPPLPTDADTRESGETHGS